MLESINPIGKICQDVFEKLRILSENFNSGFLTERRFEKMNLEKFVEEKIKQAIEAGKFDNLEGAGKPLDLNDYFSAPPEMRAGYSLLKSNNFVPEEVEILKEIGLLREEIENCADAAKKQDLTKIYGEKSLALRLMLERNKRKNY